MLVFQLPEKCGLLFANEVEQLLGIAEEASYIISNGCVVSRTQQLQHGVDYYIFPRVLGGKGGFGSMLRAIGAQIEKTTSREACRDLSGRRIRDVNNEKKLKEWVAKQADRERERHDKEERRRAKRAKYLEDNPSKMNDPQYTVQYTEIMKNSEIALQEGLAKMKDGGSTSRKRKADATSTLDKYDRWSIVNDVEVGSHDSDSGSENSDSSEAKPGTSSAHTSVSASSSSSPSSERAALTENSTSLPKRSAVSATVTSLERLDEVSDSPPVKVMKLETSSSTTPGQILGEMVKESTLGVTSSEGEDSFKQVENSQSIPPVRAIWDTEESSEPVNLEDIESAEDLQALGMERLKVDLTRRGLKCGGSLQERAQRLFSIKGLEPDEIPVKLLAKGKGQGKSSQKVN